MCSGTTPRGCTEGSSFEDRLRVILTDSKNHIQETVRVMQDNFRDLVELQRCGVRTCKDGMSRQGGAGPTDDRALVFSNGVTLMVPTLSESAGNSEYVLEGVDDHPVLKRNGKVVDKVRMVRNPKFYRYKTDEGISYKKIARLHGSECLASTVVQECIRYNDVSTRCRFCAIGVSLERGATIHTKRPEQLAEVALAARKLDGVTHVTLTTGTTDLMNKGAEHLARCAYSIKRETGLPVQAQCEPPYDANIFSHMKNMGVDDLGIHIESFDPEVRRKYTPGKASISIDAYFDSFEKAVIVFGKNKVSTFVILGLGENEELTLSRCREIIRMGVYPYLVPLRPVLNTFLVRAEPPDGEYLSRMYKTVGAMLRENGMSAENSSAGCVKCKACSVLQLTETRKHA